MSFIHNDCYALLGVRYSSSLDVLLVLASVIVPIQWILLPLLLLSLPIPLLLILLDILILILILIFLSLSLLQLLLPLILALFLLLFLLLLFLLILLPTLEYIFGFIFTLLLTLEYILILPITYKYLYISINYSTVNFYMESIAIDVLSCLIYFLISLPYYGELVLWKLITTHKLINSPIKSLSIQIRLNISESFLDI